ncbi:MAG: spore coat protein CotJB [Clostridia bacterium]|nr:spore coat protein CotJB [Clostridia bacterium]
MDRYNCPLMRQLQEVSFALVELNLYLDNYPNNQQALADFNSLSQKYQELKAMYEAQYGPLTNFGYAPSQYPWQWVNEPWPWEV